MYNLLVSASDEAWQGEAFQIELSRCVREYTDSNITAKLGGLDDTAIAELKRLPCIFAFEAFLDLPPKFGLIRDITKRQGQVRLQYEIQSIDPFLTADDLKSLTFELDIEKWEMNRTHWAVKDVNLAKELRAARGIILPSARAVDLSNHVFDVALSFPGEVRPLIEQVAVDLERRLGPHTYFYDNNYVSQLARPSLDVFLQEIYRSRSKLIVVFLSSDYQKKSWCGIEFRAVREIIFERGFDRVMFVKTDDGDVEGVFRTDGFIDARQYSPSDIARFIEERISLLARTVTPG
ncbi:TIR domain-containing protein [Methylocystis echinoides]|uniref:TIR domain-containing protein n=1 Tax=Methylocystis echinoides TaxID=29468 RepID=UPI00342DE99A